MKPSLTLKQRFVKTSKAVLAVGLFGLMLGSGALSASADAPQFNVLPQDLPTLMVAKPGQSWGTSVSDLKAGDYVNFLLWDHNSVKNSVADNVRLKIDLGGTGSTITATGTVSADNAAQPAIGKATVSGLPSNAKLQYVTDSAVFYNNSSDTSINLVQTNFPDGVNANDIVTNGINIGQQHGCWIYAHAVQIQVRVEAGVPVINTNKNVNLDNGSQPFGLSTTANPGDTVDFSIFVQNTGSATGVQPAVVDTLDSHLTYVPGSSYIVVKRNNQDEKITWPEDHIIKDGNKLTWWGFEDLGPSPDTAFYLYFKTQVADASHFSVGDTTFNNCALAEFIGNNISKNTNCVTITIHKNQTPVVSFTLRKEVRNVTLNDAEWHYRDSLATAGPSDTLEYRLTLQNTGNTDATNVSLKDLLPAGVTYIGNATLNGKAIDASSLINGGYVFSDVKNGSGNADILTFQVKLNDACPASATLTNNADVIYQGKEVAKDYVQVLEACTRGLIIQKYVSVHGSAFAHDAGQVTAGDILTYRVTVLNNGTTTVNNPLVRDSLPTNVTYVQNSLAVDGENQPLIDQNAFFGQGMVVTNLSHGMSKTITFQVKVNCPTVTSIVNTAFASGEQVPTVSDTATAEISLKACTSPTPTPPISPTPSNSTPTPGTPQLPHTGPEADAAFLSLFGFAGAGYSGRWYLLKKKLQSVAKNIRAI